MLGKATKENIVVVCTTLYDHLFAPTRECNVKITAARMPYFDGDYWSAAAVNMSKNLEQESRVGLQNKVKKVPSKRTFKAMGHSKISGDAAKDILLMQEVNFSSLPSPKKHSPLKIIFFLVSCFHIIRTCAFLSLAMLGFYS